MVMLMVVVVVVAVVDPVYDFWEMMVISSSLLACLLYFGWGNRENFLLLPLPCNTLLLLLLSSFSPSLLSFFLDDNGGWRRGHLSQDPLCLSFSISLSLFLMQVIIYYRSIMCISFWGGAEVVGDER